LPCCRDGKRDSLKLLSFLCLAVVPGTRKFITGSGFRVQGSGFWVPGSSPPGAGKPATKKAGKVHPRLNRTRQTFNPNRIFRTYGQAKVGKHESEKWRCFRFGHKSWVNLNWLRSNRAGILVLGFLERQRGINWCGNLRGAGLLRA